MALHRDFPKSPYKVLDPEIRWFPADESIRDQGAEKFIPPLVAQLRRRVKGFRCSNYAGASKTSQSLLNWWFNQTHYKFQVDNTKVEFRYYFAQQEAMETIIYLHDVAGVQDKYDLMRFDATGRVSTGMFDESWRRFVLKMATGTGKTRVMSLAVLWSYFHKLYEPESQLSRNFLIIAPNIIVLDRLYRDFQGLGIFYDDSVLPNNGFDGREWHDDFQVTLHKQDDVRVHQPVGNIFLTNIHRVYAGNDIPPSPEDANTKDFFLGKSPSGAATDSKIDLSMVVRDIDELMVVNDEAHHIHDAKLAWFKSIEDIHNQMKQKGTGISLQVDLTATPKHSKGDIFVQTVADYPLVEAISQNVVKHPVLPDEASRAKLSERKSVKFTEKYADYINLGVIEWRKSFLEHEKLGKKAILFAMADDTKNCDELAEYLERYYPDLKDSVLVIHTRRNGEILEETSGKAKAELAKLRILANEIDNRHSPYKAIVSVLVLKEGWDVRNVTTIVGLRAFSTQSNILPEQTLGRGLRRMYTNDAEEYVSVVGTDAFMDFVESIQAEGIELERKPMGTDSATIAPLIVEVDHENDKKDLDKLDIEIPNLTRHVYREFNALADLDIYKFGHQPVAYCQFSEDQQRQIIFRDIASGEIAHMTVLDVADVIDYRNIIGYFARTIIIDLRLVGGYDVLYGKIKKFIETELFGKSVELNNLNTLRNLSAAVATKTLIEVFEKSINALTLRQKSNIEVQNSSRLRDTKPFSVQNQKYVLSEKSIFNRIVGDSNFELKFAEFLNKCPDVVSYAKNYFAINFKLDYVNASGAIANYYPDFLVKLSNTKIVIVETKGLVDADVPLKLRRLHQWCEDVNRLKFNDFDYDFVYVDYDGFKKQKFFTFQQIIDGFREYK